MKNYPGAKAKLAPEFALRAREVSAYAARHAKTQRLHLKRAAPARPVASARNAQVSVQAAARA